MKKKIEKITKNTVLGKIIKKKGAGEILMSNDVPCVTCPMAQMEMDELTIGDICEAYGLNLKKILKELNA